MDFPYAPRHEASPQGQETPEKQIMKRWQHSLWDSMILAAAQSSGAKELITEDLSHGQQYGSVRVTNPFLNPVSKT